MSIARKRFSHVEDPRKEPSVTQGTDLPEGPAGTQLHDRLGGGKSLLRRLSVCHGAQVTEGFKWGIARPNLRF